MKRFIQFITLVTCIITLSSCNSINTNATAVSSNADRQENALNEEALEHYEMMFKDSWLFSPDSEVKIVPISSDKFGVSEEKTDGKTVVYNLGGDIARFISPAILDSKDRFIDHNFTKVFEYHFEMLPDENKIIGTLIINDEIIRKQNENGLSYLKEVLQENGVEQSEFKYDEGKIFYGNKEVTGDIKDIILDTMYGFPDILRCFEDIEVCVYENSINIDCF